MDERTARALIALNNRFYAEHAASFSATRQAPWAGWRRVIEEATALGAIGTESTDAADADAPARPELHVLDLAAGNLRFERFLAEFLPATPLAIDALDRCDALMAAAPGGNSSRVRVRTHHRDILEALLAGIGASDALAPRAPYDLAVCFGFMHHVPTLALRTRLLAALVRALCPGGAAAVSFWQFMDDERLARKAARAEAAARAAAAAPGNLRGSTPAPALGFSPAALEPGDHLLGWQDDPSAFRYCHHASDAEIDALVATLPVGTAREAARFSADGASGALNRYLILQRC